MDTKLEYLARTVYRSSIFSELLFELNKDRYLANNRYANSRSILDDVSRYHNTTFPPAELRRQEFTNQTQGNPNNKLSSNASDEASSSNKTQQKFDRRSAYSYKSEYGKPYGAKALIDIVSKRAKLFYRILGDYFTRFKESLQSRGSNKEPYNSPESPTRIRTLKPFRYLPVVVYEIVRSHKYNVKELRYNIREHLKSRDEKDDHENLEDILKSA